MGWRQLVDPNTWAQDNAGWCLRFTQRVYRNLNPYYYDTALVAWQNTKHRSKGRDFPPGCAVPVWFDHWAEYGGVYKNWGHVAVRFPNGAVLSSPGYGYGQQWFNNIEEVVSYFGGGYLGWSQDIGGLLVAQYEADPAPPVPEPEPEPVKTRKRQKNMFVIYYKDANGPGKEGWAITGPNYFAVMESRENTKNIMRQLDIEYPLEVNKAGWQKFKAAANA